MNMVDLAQTEGEVEGEGGWWVQSRKVGTRRTEFQWCIPERIGWKFIEKRVGD